VLNPATVEELGPGLQRCFIRYGDGDRVEAAMLLRLTGIEAEFQFRPQPRHVTDVSIDGPVRAPAVIKRRDALSPQHAFVEGQ